MVQKIASEINSSAVTKADAKPPRPPKPSTDIEAIREHLPELVAHKQWVCWEYRFVRGRWTKVPLRIVRHESASKTKDGTIKRSVRWESRNAKSNDPSTWMTFEEAADALVLSGKADGIGYVPTDADGFVFIDMDDAFHEQGDLKDEAREVIDSCDTYKERTPSGRGVRVIGRGYKPPGCRTRDKYKTVGVEVYEAKQFLTITGNVLADSSTAINDITAAVEEIAHMVGLITPPPEKPATPPPPESVPDDIETILDRAFSAKNGAKLRRLFDGDLCGLNSESERDASLLWSLAFWVPDAGMLEAIARTSACARDKWDSQRPDGTWISRECEVAVASQPQFYDWSAGPKRIAPPPRVTMGGDRRKCHASDKEAQKQTKKKTVTRLAEFKPFPVEHLPHGIRRFVEETASAIGCDTCFIALPALAAASAAIGNTRVILLKRGWCEPAVLWTAPVGVSGSLKSPAYDAAIRPLSRLDKERRDEFKAAHAAHAAEKEEWMKQKKTGKDAGPAPEPPVWERHVVRDVTIERLAEVLEDSPRGVLATRDELSGWVSSFNRYKDKGGSDESQWLEMHRAGVLTVDRRTSERRSLYVPRAFTAVTGTVQPGVLAKLFQKNAFDSGLAARFLMAYPPNQRKQWSEREASQDVIDAYDRTIRALAGLSFNHGKDGAEPVVLTLGFDAKPVWVRWYNQFAERQDAAEGELKAALSKIEGAAARLALIHHCTTLAYLDAPDARPVSRESIEAGIAIAEWFAHETGRIYALFAETEEQRRLRELVEFIERQGGRITVRQLQRANSRKWPNADAAEAALSELVDAGLASWEVSQRPGGGHPLKTLVLHPTHDTSDTCSGDTNAATSDTCSDGRVSDAEETAHESDVNDYVAKDFGEPDGIAF